MGELEREGRQRCRLARWRSHRRAQCHPRPAAGPSEQAGARGWPDWSPRYASLKDITAFIEGRTDDTLIADLLWGLSLIDWQMVEKETLETTSESEFVPSSFYALLKLCFRPKGKNKAIPLVPAIHHRAHSGDGLAASQLAARRLRGSGYPPLIEKLPVAASVARRTAAALLFPN